jgi:hypothetical protein
MDVHSNFTIPGFRRHVTIYFVLGKKICDVPVFEHTSVVGERNHNYNISPIENSNSHYEISLYELSFGAWDLG